MKKLLLLTLSLFAINAFAQKGRRALNLGRHENILRFDRTGNQFHPTEKPLALCEFLIKKSMSKCLIYY
jgi:DNA modification methylase